MRFRLFLLVAVLSGVIWIAGCSTTMSSRYKAGPSEPTARVRLIANTDSTGAMGHHYNFYLYQNSACEHGSAISLGGQLIADLHQELPAVDIPAGREISLMVIHGEGRFGQSRTCGDVVRLQPQSGQSYVLNFQVRQQGMQCTAKLRSPDSGEVASLPITGCHALKGQGGKPVPNGQALVTQFHVKVVREP